jgi:cardiolipin synthase
MVLVFLPILGMVLYFFFGRDARKTRLIGRRFLSQLKQRDRLYSDIVDYCEIPQEYSSLISFFKNSSMASPFAYNDALIMHDMSCFSSSLLNELRNASEHIHMQFYIIENDNFGREVAAVLMEKARNGVEVRLIYDSVGCWNVDKDFFEQMRCAGVYVESFLKVRFPLLTNKANYRNHRKIVVIDGRVGFVGGCNVADRYINGVDWGKWRDTMLMVKGAAVHGLQASFLVDWYFSNSTLVSGKRYFPHVGKEGNTIMQIVTSNPVGEVRTIISGLVKLISAAKGYVFLQTPYFMPDEPLMLALKSAAISGVDVRLMIPLRSDSWVADHISMSYLGDVLRAGVKVYLYGGGMLHSKTVVCDDYVTSVGSANLDFRSFYYNFEVCAFMYGKDNANEIKRLFIEDMSQCVQLTLAKYAERSFFHRCLESFARLFSPLF